MFWQSITVALLFSLAVFASAQTQPAPDASRGELLYTTHCIACHTAQVHWREKKIVSSLAILQTEVRRWQGLVGLGWNNDDVGEVARYLNALHYRFPAPA